MQEQGIDSHEIYLVKRLHKKSHNYETENHIYIMSKWPRGLAKETDAETDTKVPLVLQTLADGKCYCGELSIKEMEKAAVELNIAKTMFIGECRMALSTSNASDTVALFEFELQQENNKIMLIVTKQCLKLRLRYVEVELTEQSNNAVMLDALVALVQYMPYSPHLQHQSATMETEKKLDMTKALEACVTAQEQMKREMLTKFCLLLNSKKKKICELQQQLDRLQATDKSASNDEEPNSNADNADDDIFNADTQPMQIN